MSTVRRFPTRQATAEEAARHVAAIVAEVVAKKGHAHIIFATGASQFEFLAALAAIPDLPWDKVTGFHLDEYVGIEVTHPASFRKYLNDRFFNLVQPRLREVHLLDPGLDAKDAAAACRTYSRLLVEDEIDLACIGIGENGHIAFNDPPVANFNDPVLVKVVELDEACRRQQLGEGWFPSLAAVPTHALTLTCPAILRALRISCVVPDDRKAEAVRGALQGPIETACPASVLRRHADCVVWIDEPAASLLEGERGSGGTKRRREDERPQQLQIPGFVDIQVNGRLGVDFSGPGLTEERFRAACRSILDPGTGTVGFLATVITTTRELYEHNLGVIGRVVRSGDFPGLLGIHLEGPFLSAEPGAVGCHDPGKVLRPSVEFLELLLSWADCKGEDVAPLGAGASVVKMITIAAEPEGADALCRACVARGIRVALGHQQADSVALRRLADAGATLLTHLGNGMPASVHRHNNAILEGLSVPELGASLITDGHHLPPHVIRTVLRAAGSTGVIVISDAAPVAGLGPGRHECLGTQVELSATGCVRHVETGYLAGSAATMLDCMQFLQGLGFMNLSELEDVGFRNPLRLLGFDPDRQFAGIAPVVRFSAEGGFAAT